MGRVGWILYHFPVSSAWAGKVSKIHQQVGGLLRGRILLVKFVVLQDNGYFLIVSNL